MSFNTSKNISYNNTKEFNIFNPNARVVEPKTHVIDKKLINFKKQNSLTVDGCFT